MDNTLLYGRQQLINRQQLAQHRGRDWQIMPTIQVGTHQIFCYRCGTKSNKEKSRLGHNNYFCPRCINLGRVSTLDCFVHLPEPNQFNIPQEIISWTGKLSPLQETVSQKVAQGMDKHIRQLLWAVTGAGKTEMIFAGIRAALSRGERVAIASPRVDVCLELYPRIQAAFRAFEVCLLHGRSDQPYRYRQLTICTTHQLLKFYHAFDNLIVDEVDSFPYAANQALLYATNNAIKSDGGLLLMTATPGELLERQVKCGQLTTNYLPLRYHGHLLPTIQIKLSPSWRKQLGAGRIDSSLIRALRKTKNNGHRCLLFVPHVKDLAPVANALQKVLPNSRFTTVHAADSNRLEKVQKMRAGQYDLLITTSILERGVTFPEIDVYVLGADDQVFSTSALVQIAGRAGRSQSRPTGAVIYWVAALSKTVNNARHQINMMNRKGRHLQHEVLAL